MQMTELPKSPSKTSMPLGFEARCWKPEPDCCRHLQSQLIGSFAHYSLAYDLDSLGSDDYRARNGPSWFTSCSSSKQPNTQSCSHSGPSSFHFLIRLFAVVAASVRGFPTVCRALLMWLSVSFTRTLQVPLGVCQRRDDISKAGVASLLQFNGNESAARSAGKNICLGLV